MGPAIRYWEFARTVSQAHDVTLLVTNEDYPSPPDFSVRCPAAADSPPNVSWYSRTACRWSRSAACRGAPLADRCANLAQHVREREELYRVDAPDNG